MRDMWKVARQNERSTRAGGRHVCCRVVKGVPCPEPAVDFIMGDPGDRLEQQYPNGYPYWLCAEHHDEAVREGMYGPPEAGR